MAIKTMYRMLNTVTGEIKLYDMTYFRDTILLDEIQVEYEDTLKEEHREMLIEAIEKNIEEKERKHKAEMFMLQAIKGKLLLLGAPKEGVVMPAQEPARPPRDTDDMEGAEDAEFF